jgi:uncharacterized protein YcfL
MQTLQGDPALASELKILHPRSERRDGRLVVQFELVNERAGQLDLEWAIEWFDAGELRVDAPERWTPIAIGGRGSKTLQATGPTPSAISWRLAVRRPSTVQ